MGATAGAIRSGRAFVELFADDSKLQAVLKRSQVRLLSFSDFVRTVGLRISGLGFALSLPFVKATSDFAKFDDKMREVAGVISASESELASLEKTARRLAQQKGTAFLATDIASLMAELGRAGFASGEINKMTRSVLLLGRATQTELPLAAKITGSTMRQFKLGINESAHVADLLAKTANASATSVESLGASLEYAGLPAAQLGYSLKTTLSIIGVLGNLGIVGTEAGTAIRRLGALTASQATEMQKIFGVAFKDSKGNALPMVDVLEKVSQATAKLGSADRLKKFHDAFGILGITSSIALGANAKSVRALEKELDNVAGYAEEAAKRMDGGIGGSLRRFWAALFDGELSVGRALEKHLIPIIDKVTVSLKTLSQWIEAHPLEVKGLAEGAVKVAVVGTAFVGLGTAGGLLALNLRGIGYALHAAVSPAKLLSNALGGVLSLAYRAEKLGSSWTGMLVGGVGFGGRGKRQAGPKITKKDVGKSVASVVAKRTPKTSAFKQIGTIVRSGASSIGGGLSKIASGTRLIQTAWVMVRPTLSTAWGVLWAGIRTSGIAMWGAMRVAGSAMWTGIGVASRRFWVASRIAAVRLWSGISGASAVMWSVIRGQAMATWRAIRAVGVATWTIFRDSSVTVFGLARSAGLAAFGAIRAAGIATFRAISFVAMSTWSIFSASAAGTWGLVRRLGIATWGAIRFVSVAMWSGFMAANRIAWGLVRAVGLAAWGVIGPSAVAMWGVIRATGLALWTGIRGAGIAMWIGVRAAGTAMWVATGIAGAAMWAGMRTSGIAMWAAVRVAGVVMASGLGAARRALAPLAKGIGLVAAGLFQAGVAASGLVIRLAGIAAIKAFGGLVSGVGLLLNPMTLLVGAGIAVVANWDRIKGAIGGVVSSAPGALSGMWSRIKGDALPTLLGIKDTAVSAFGGISAAIQAGDIPAAMSILWSGLKAVWAEGFGYLRMKWFDLTTWASDSFNSVLQMAVGIAPGIANVFDLALFDWFGIRLTDVTSAFSTSWNWIKEATGSTATWIQETWAGMFGASAAGAIGFTDILFHGLESIRKKYAQILLAGYKVVSFMADFDLTGLTSKLLGTSNFNLGDALKELDDQFEERADKRTQLKHDIKAGIDPDAKARQDAAQAKIDDLEKQRKKNALSARADRAQIEEDLRKKLELEKENLAAVVAETAKKRELRDATEEAANAGQKAGAAGSASPTGPQMPAGLTRQQQRSWQLKDQIRQRNEFFAEKKAAAKGDRYAADYARREKKKSDEEARLRTAAGGLIPGRKLFIQPSALFNDSNTEDSHNADIEDAMRARADLKNRVPDLQAMRMGSHGGRAELSSTGQIKIDASGTERGIGQTNGKLDQTNQLLSEMIRKLPANWG